MTPNLGLVCITSGKAIRYRTITRKRLLALSPQEQHQALLVLYRDNLETLSRVPAYCNELGTRLYRIPSGIFPFADEPVGIELLETLAAELADCGTAASAQGLRLVMHPDQFVVLNSDSPSVVQNSIKILSMHARILDALQQPRTPWATIEIHGGKGNRAEALVDAVRGLPVGVRARLALENDEYIYSAEQILAICREAGIPMVFDAHHHVCHAQLDSYAHPSIARMTALARETWPRPEWQLVHISNGRERFTDRRHSDEIDDMPDAFARVPWIEVEAKQKEFAIRRLHAEWQPSRIG